MRSVSGIEWYILLKGLRQTEELLFFPAPVNSRKLMEDYIRIRDKWIREGLISLDFDGGIECTKAFYRDVYNLTCWSVLTRIESKGKSRLFVRGPVDFLKAEYADDKVNFESIRHSDFYKQLKELAAMPETILIVTKRCGEADSIRTERDGSSAGSQGSAAETAGHLKLIYRGGNNGQPDHHNTRA